MASKDCAIIGRVKIVCIYGKLQKLTADPLKK